MEIVSAFLFSLWLWIKISSSLLRIVALLLFGFVWVMTPVLAICIWLAIVIFFIGKNALNEKARQQQELVNTRAASARLARWEKLNAKRPGSRDILLNLSTLYLAQGNREKANEASRAAVKIDPSLKKN